MTCLFVGERRSAKAVRMGVRWSDGRLAAKQLFDALRAAGEDPARHLFVNCRERGTLARVRSHDGPVIALGRLAQAFLLRHRVAHVPMVHPAARGAIRRKDRYAAHVLAVLDGVRAEAAGSDRMQAPLSPYSAGGARGSKAAV